MTIRLNSPKLREIGVRSGPSFKKIGNGFIVSCPRTEDTHRETLDEAISLFDERQKQFIADEKESADKTIARLEKEIYQQKKKKSDIVEAMTEAREQVQKQIDNFKETA